jgi:hypothetical protein
MLTAVKGRASSVDIEDSYQARQHRDPYLAIPSAMHRLAECLHSWFVMVM